MCWLKPIEVPYVRPRRPVRRTDGAMMPELKLRAVTIDGTRYDSMVEACRALRWSYSKVYKAIGEGWRYAKKKAVTAS